MKTILIKVIEWSVIRENVKNKRDRFVLKWFETAASMQV